VFDPNDVIEIEIKGVGKFKSRLMTERQLKQFNRDINLKGKTMSLEAHHAALNEAMGKVLVDVDFEDLTIGQKRDIVNQLPWAVAAGELERTKKVSASPSESPTSSSAENASPENAAAT
jgi:hypothetical protein